MQNRFNHRLANYFYQLSKYLQKIDNIKENIFNSYYFDSLDLFQSLDYYSKTYLDKRDLQNFFDSFNECIPYQDINNLFNYIDCDQSGTINYDEFAQFITPFNFYYKNIKNSYNVHEIRINLIDLFMQVIHLIQFQLDSIKNLEQIYDFSLNRAFNSIDIYRQGFIRIQDLYEFQDINGLNINQHQLNLLFKFINRNPDQKLNIKTFSTFFINYEYDLRESYLLKKSLPLNESIRKKSVNFDKSPQKSLQLSKSILNSEKKLNKSLKNSDFLSSKKQVKSLKSSQQLNNDQIDYINYLSNSQKIEKQSYSKPKQNKVIVKSVVKLQLIQLLKDIMNDEKSVECQKQILSSQKDFNLFDSFKIFDFRGCGDIDQHQFLKVLNSLGIDYKFSDIQSLFDRLDSNRFGSIGFKQFIQMILPAQKEYQKLLKQREPIYVKKFTDFCLDTQQNFLKLLQMQVVKEDNALMIRHQIRSRYTASQLFIILDKNEKGYFTKEDVRKFLKRNDVHPTHDELNCLFNRFNPNNDGRITYEEFQKELIY